MPISLRKPAAADAGFSLIELIVAMGLLTMIMGATLAGLANVTRGSETVMSISSMNAMLRTGVDLMIRDLLQTGSGLPSSHAVIIPNGANSVRVRIPGPPGTAFETPAGALTMPAVMPRSNAGPTINGVATDVLTVLMADNAFLEVGITAMTGTSITVAAGPVLDTGADRVLQGQLMLVSKGSMAILVQVTDVNATTRVLTFGAGDSLLLNQPTAAQGNLGWLNAQTPANQPGNVRISRVRMITYYLDATSNSQHPRLVRRINAGHHTTFNNTTQGTAVATDIFNLQFTYDISNGAGNPGSVEMSAADLGTTGACSPAACAETQVRKVNIRVTARTLNTISGAASFFNNTLESQVSLRSMAFVDRYRSS